MTTNILVMTSFLTIRKRLGLTQVEIAAALGMTQGNVSFYERGQTVPPQVAGKLIELAKAKGFDLSYDDVYGAHANLATSPNC